MNAPRFRAVATLVFMLMAAPFQPAWGLDSVSFQETMGAIRSHLTDVHEPEVLANLTASQALAAMTENQRKALAEQYLSFQANVPVVVSVIRDSSLSDEPFWLASRGFQPTDGVVQVGRHEFDVWQKEFPAGTLGLGVSTLKCAGRHYFVAVRPRQTADTLRVEQVQPPDHTLGVMNTGETPFYDGRDTLTGLPSELSGQILIRGSWARRRETQLENYFRITDYPSSPRPDHIVLTWSGDPKTTQTIQWRTTTQVLKGVVAYQKKSDYHRFNPRRPIKVEAVTERLETPETVNDPVIHRHVAELVALEPGTTYVYSLGDGSKDNWAELREFTTAPDRTDSFSFMYLGDPQNGLERWGSLMDGASRERPDAAFCVIAGDLVNRGNDRDDWDRLFENGEGFFDQRPVVPALGNHEYAYGEEPRLYLDLLTLPEGGPFGEKTYAFEYGNALFVILDSNLPAKDQAEWLEQQLAGTDAVWKFVVYHHPAYSSSPYRDNVEIRTAWGALFDQYHVDVALQGHDHAYLRTYPMKGGQRVASPADGTIYLVAVSGTKYYGQGDFDYKEFGITNTSTYQVLDLQISGDRLVYRAYDIDGDLRDSFTIEK